jgi:DNA-directed RNA polymerase subunit N (RpoN/RPB10)
VSGTYKHAKRRAHEMRDAAELLDELGVPATITRATAESLERIVADGTQTPDAAASDQPASSSISR